MLQHAKDDARNFHITQCAQNADTFEEPKKGTGNSKGVHGQMLRKLLERYFPSIPIVVRRRLAHDQSVMKLLKE